MIWMLAFTALMALLAVAVGLQWLPTKIFDPLLEILHGTVGISTPPPRQVRIAVIVWIVSAVVIIDGMFLLFAYAFCGSCGA